MCVYIYIYIKGSLLVTLFITETCKIPQAWDRLCKCLGQKFQPYMEVAIPCLLQSARLTLPDDANIEESDDERWVFLIEIEEITRETNWWAEK